VKDFCLKWNHFQLDRDIAQPSKRTMMQNMRLLLKNTVGKIALLTLVVYDMHGAILPFVFA
jgi:hypothetical protein